MNLKIGYMCRIFEFLKTNFIFVIGGLVLLLAIWSLFCQSKPPPAINEGTAILFPADSSRLQKENALSNNTILINLLQEREAIDANSIESKKSLNMQSLMFYCAIMAGLMSLLFTRKGKESKILTSVFLFFIIALLYLVDVHQQDLIQRNESPRKITSEAVDLLVIPYNDTVYKLSYDSMNAQYDSAANPGRRWFRKLYAVYHPNLPQIVYYIIPWLLIFIYIIHLRFSGRSCKSLKRKVSKNNDDS